MAVREYIGARYVPLFADPVEWDNTRAYEPLTIVVYQGDSYTSKQSVPVGINILNTEYWVCTGNYNAQIEAYRRETANVALGLQDVQHDIDDIDEAVAQVRRDVSANTLAIGNESQAREQADNTINDRIDDAETAIEEVQEQLNDVSQFRFFDGHGMVVIGDSYAYGTGASDHLSGDTKRFTSLLAARLNATEYNFAVGSTGFCDPGSGGQNMPFPSQIDRAAQSLTDEEKADVHLVLIAGGINDYREGATYSGGDMGTASRTCCEKATSAFPNAQILVVPMLLNGRDVNPRLFNFESALIDGCAGSQGQGKTTYIKGAWTWNFGAAGRFASDGLHPNDTGHRCIANKIYSHITGGDAYEDKLLGITWESGFSSGVDNGGYLILQNGQVESFGILVNLSTLVAGSITKIGSVAPAAVPLVNVIVPIMKGNDQAGSAIITDNGNLYARIGDTDVSTQMFIAPFSYIPRGVISS